jgi:ribosomal protein S18 acetylase RimI-like enzyme
VDLEAQGVVDAGEVAVRLATADDYGAFTRLFPELGVDELLPTSAVWSTAFVPYTRVAQSLIDGPEILGYCYAQEYDDTGYVRHLVVAPGARRRGVGRALMLATGRHLRAAGKTGWRLNVGASNAAAHALYARLGMRTLYASTAVRVPWTSLPALPEARAQVRELPPARDAEIERLFALPRGQLTAARGTKRLILGALAEAGACAGLAVFSPAFPGAFPFRALDQAAARPLLEAMRPHVEALCPYVNLVIDDDEPLARLLTAAGAEVRASFLHLGGAL